MALKHAPTGTMYSEFPVLHFGGLNTRDSSIHIEDNQAQDLMNVNFDNKGAIAKRTGYTAYNGTAIDGNPVKSLLPFYKSNGTKYLLATSATSIYNVTGGTVTAIKTGLTGNAQRFTSAVYKDSIYMLNGVDGLMKWDSSSFSIVAGAPNGKYVVTHKNRLYVAGDPNNTSRVYFSDLGAPDTFGGLSFVDINTNDGDIITGMVEHLDSLVIFKERSIHIVRGTGPQNFSFVDSHQSHGTVCHWSVVSIKNRLFYLSRDGVYYFDGKAIHLASDLIKGSILGFNGNQGWNQQYLVNACAIEYKNKYWLAVPEGLSQSLNNRVYLMDYDHGIWTRYDIPIGCLTLFQNATTLQYELFSGDVAGGNVFKQDSGNSDNGNAITAYLQTKDFDFSAPAHYKSYKGFYFYAVQANQNYGINISYIQDRGKRTRTVSLPLGGSSQGAWGTGTWDPMKTWGGVSNIAKKTTAVAGQSKYIAFRVSDNSKNPWTFLGWIIRFKVKRRLN